VPLEVTLVVTVAALSGEKGGTDDLAVRTGAILDEVAGVALLLQPRVEADLAEGLPWLALSWAGSTASPCRAGFNPSVVLGTLWAAGAIAVPTLLGNDGESKRGHDETGKTRAVKLKRKCCSIYSCLVSRGIPSTIVGKKFSIFLILNFL